MVDSAALDDRSAMTSARYDRDAPALLSSCARPGCAAGMLFIIALRMNTRFCNDSGIDLAVEGIPWPAYLHAWNDVERLFTEFKVDLIDVSVVSDRMRQRIDEHGVEI